MTGGGPKQKYEEQDRQEDLVRKRNQLADIHPGEWGDKRSEDVTETLGEALPREMTRVRDVVIPAYLDPALNGAGALAAAMMRQSLDNAQRALAEGDVVAMLRAYEDLKGYEV